MKVEVLGCSGAIARGRRTTAFRVGERLLIDAGTGVGDLDLAAMARIDHVLLSHCHLDHIAALPLMVDAVAALRDRPLMVHALPATVAALRQHIFNGLIWPNFEILPSVAQPFIQFGTFDIGDVLELGGVAVEILPAAHTVPAAGFAVSTRRDGPAWIFSGDTGRNPAFWQRVNQRAISALVIETAFSDSDAELADKSRHLSPATLAAELAQLARPERVPVWITHTKPAEAELIMREIGGLQQQPGGALARLDIRGLEEGDSFVL